MKTGAVIQARMGSSRFSGKVLKTLPFRSGLTVLNQVLSRIGKSTSIDEIIVATTMKNMDDDLVTASEKAGVRYFRGSEDDVLSRYYHASLEAKLDRVVRVTSDCPCIDPDVIDELSGLFNEGCFDYVSNTVERSFPRGLDVEVFSFEALEVAFREAERVKDREHVTPYLYSGKFRTGGLKCSLGDLSDIRITLDTEEDYALLCAVFEFLYPRNPDFRLIDISRLFREKEWLKMINVKIDQKREYNSLDEEVEKAVKLLKSHNLNHSADLIRSCSIK